jgi:DNA invertase Pin-like site-specific DNA recombinase
LSTLHGLRRTLEGLDARLNERWQPRWDERGTTANAADERLTPRGTRRVQLSHPVGLLFNVLAMVAEFEADLARAHTGEGMAVARALRRRRRPRRGSHAPRDRRAGG